jgi:hypothetical protein
MLSKGFSADVAARIANSHRSSTQQVYNSRWNGFCSWCESRGRDPLSASAPLVAEFLTHLFRDKSLCVSTLAGYRSVLLNTLKDTLKDRCGADFTENSQLKKLLASFAIERPRSMRTLPQWDLALVTRLRDVTLEGLASFAGNLEEDKTLCPVRAIKVYLALTASIRSGRKEFFVPYKPGAKQSIAAATISSWIQKTIRYAYQDASTEEASLGQVRAHDLRALAASWNLHCSIPLSDILRAAQWRCHTTFTSFYLRDMSLVEDDLLRLGPISTGQAIPST